MVGCKRCSGEGDVNGAGGGDVGGHGEQAGGGYDDGGSVNSGVSGVEKVCIQPDISVDPGEADAVAEGTFFGLVFCPGVPLTALDGGEGARPEGGQGAKNCSHGLLAGTVRVGGADAASYVVAASVVRKGVVADGSAK